MANEIPDKYKEEMREQEEERKKRAKYLRDILEAGT